MFNIIISILYQNNTDIMIIYTKLDILHFFHTKSSKSSVYLYLQHISVYTSHISNGQQPRGASDCHIRWHCSRTCKLK